MQARLRRKIFCIIRAQMRKVPEIAHDDRKMHCVDSAFSQLFYIYLSYPKDMQQKNGSKYIYYIKDRNISAPKMIKKTKNDLKSNRQYFDLKSPFKDHGRKNDQRSSKKRFKFMIPDQ
jgi:hypothetical protein